MMDEVLKCCCDSLSENRNVIMKEFGWVPETMRVICAVIYTCSGERVNGERLKESAKILNREEHFYSEFRGTLRPTVFAKMAMSENPEQYYRQLRQIYELFGEQRSLVGEQRLLGALHIMEQVEPERARDAVERTEAICQRMHKRYPLLPDLGDFSTAAVLASHQVNPEILFDDMEHCYRILQEQFHAGAAANVCSHLLSMSNAEAAEKCRKLFEIWNGLKAGKHRYGVGKEMAILTALSLLPISAEEIVHQIEAADDCLRKKSGFDFLRIGVIQRRMYAAQMVLLACARKEMGISHTRIPGSTALEIAQAVCSTVIATTSASSLPAFLNRNC